MEINEFLENKNFFKNTRKIEIDKYPENGFFF